MNQNEIIRTLRSNRQRLHSMGVTAVSLFGSTARGEEREQSDIDLAVRLDARFSAGGFDYFAKMESLRGEFAAMLGRPVDVIEEPVRMSRLQQAIERDRVVAIQ